MPSGYDPVGDFDEKPSPARGEAKWLEIPDAALLLEAARTYRPTPGKGGWRPVPFAYELIATLLLMCATYLALEAAAEGPEQGADEFLIKPFLRDTLVKQVERLLARRA